MGKTRIIWLRAVNVGGATLPMAELRELLGDLGATDVQTYIQSGNVVCVPPGKPEAFDRALERAIEAKYGFFRESISRTPAEVKTALAAYPFDAEEIKGEPKRAYISFMTGPPTAAAIEKARTFETGDDDWQVIGQELHLFHAHGAGKPTMKSASIGRALKVPATARNLNTVRKVLDLADG
ncbi:MAG: DUF1697 domain-containing protein [Aeromicrobium sp.]